MKKFIIVITIFLFIAYFTALVVPVDPDEQRAGTRLSGDFAENQDPNPLPDTAFNYGSWMDQKRWPVCWLRTLRNEILAEER